MTLIDLEGRGRRGQNFLADVHPRMTEFGTVTDEGKVYCWGSATSTFQGAGPSVLEKYLGSMRTPRRFDVERR